MVLPAVRAEAESEAGAAVPRAPDAHAARLGAPAAAEAVPAAGRLRGRVHRRPAVVGTGR